MANPQLVDYIKGQFAAGVPKEGVLGSLRAAGWTEPDITEAMRSVEMNMSAQAAGARSADDPSFGVAKSGTPSMSPTSGVRDSAVNPQFPPTKIFTDVESKKPVETGNARMTGPVIAKMSQDKGIMIKISSRFPFKKEWVKPGIFGIVILALAAGLWFTYQSSVSTTAALSAQTQTDQATISSLQSQVTQLTSENTSLTVNRDNTLQSLTTAESELAFFVVPSGVSATMPITFDMQGVLSEGAGFYAFKTADNGITLNIKNSRSPDLATILRPLVSQTIQIKGTHLPASRDVTVTVVNGTAVGSAVPTAPAAASSTTTPTAP